MSKNLSPRAPRIFRLLLACLLPLGLLAASCGDDQTAQEKYCESGEELQASIDDLVGLDPVAAGKDGVEDALDDVVDSVDSLKDNAADAAKDEVDALDAAVDDAKQALDDLGSDLTSDSVSVLTDAWAAVQSAAAGVVDTLSDCP